MIGLSLLGFFLVGNALARLIALMAPQSWCARIWDPEHTTGPGISLVMRAYRRRLLVANAAAYLWLGLWVAIVVLVDQARPGGSSGRATLLLVLALVVPLVGLAAPLLVFYGRPRE